MIALIVIALALFVWAMLATSGWIISDMRNKANLDIADTELASYKRVGKWYEQRVEELENETRQLAAQVVASGSIVQHAMPLPPADYPYDYASDPTGLVVERLDPRDDL